MAKRGRPTKVKMSYDEAKDAAIEKVILHMLHPDEYSMPQMTFEEIALLMSKSEDDMMSKMGICKLEQRACKKLKKGLAKIGINSLSDVWNTTKDTSCAKKQELS